MEASKPISRMPAYVAGLVLALVATPMAGAQVVFTDIGPSKGIEPYVMPIGFVSGIAAADYDNDGFVDVFVPNAGGAADQLYHNLGNGSFEEVAGDVGLASTENNRAALWFDYNGDHRLDLVVGSDCLTERPLVADPCASPVNQRLYRQKSDGTFEDVTVAANLDVGWGTRLADSHHAGFAAGDIDNDGYLDLFASSWGHRLYLYRNNTDGTFSDVTVASNVSVTPYHHHQPVMYDFNGDGWIDIYVAVDLGINNYLLINQQNGTFVDEAFDAGVDNGQSDMGVALGDYDNDGDIDIYVTEITRSFIHNIFYRNDSVGPNLAYTEIALDLGVDDSYWGWGTTFLDCNNDMLLDLAATNGWFLDRWDDDPSKFWLNMGGNPITYSDVSNAVQFNDTFIGSSLIAFDYNRDGDVDMMQTTSGGPLRLMDNVPNGEPGSGHYLVVRPRMPGTNYFAIGSVVRVTVGSTTMMRPIVAGISYMGQEPAEAFFGLGSATVADQVVVEYPNGEQVTLKNVAGDQVITVVGIDPDLDSDGDLDLNDYAGFVECMNGPGVLPSPSSPLTTNDCVIAFDSDADNDVDSADANAFMQDFTGSQ